MAAVLSLNNGPLGDRDRRCRQSAQPRASRTVRGLHDRRRPPDDGRRVSARLQAAVSQAQWSMACGRSSTAHDPTGTIVGEPVMVVDGFRLLDADGRRLGRVSLVLLVAVIVLLFRSLRWVIVPLAVVLVSIIVTEGIIAYSHWRLTIVSSMLSSIITIIAIATVIHLIVHFRELRARGLAARCALRAPARSWPRRFFGPAPPTRPASAR